MSQNSAVIGEQGVRDSLAATISAAMLADRGFLSVYDGETDEWTSLSWPEVHARAEQIAAQLIADARSQGRTPGALGLVGDPTHDLVAAIHGAWLAGVAVSILPGPTRGAQPERWAQSTSERFARIGVDTVLGAGTELDLLSGHPGALRIAPVGDYARHTDTTGFRPRHVDPDAAAVLQGTAGSTGEPKTAVLSVSAAHANAAEIVSRRRIADGDVGLSWLPLYHDMGLTFVMAAMVSGMPLWLAPNSAFAAAPFRWTQWLSEFGVTVTAAPNFAYDILGRYARLLEAVDLSRVKCAISGGEPIDPDAFDRFLREMNRFGFDPAAAAPSYGMAESTCAVTMPRHGEGAHYDEVTVTLPDADTTVRRRYAILGEPLSGTEIRIVPPSVAAPEVDGREVGQVQIRGRSMMNGYLGRDRLVAGEWFDTGDLGYLVDGRLVICGRAKEVVIVAGRNLFPVEIERAAATVEGVRRGGVVAMARAEGATRPGLVIVAEYRGSDVEAARASVGAAVASDCGIVPAEVVFVAPHSVPRTTSGKVRRLETAEMLRAGNLQRID